MQFLGRRCIDGGAISAVALEIAPYLGAMSKVRMASYISKMWAPLRRDAFINRLKNVCAGSHTLLPKE